MRRCAIEGVSHDVTGSNGSKTESVIGLGVEIRSRQWEQLEFSLLALYDSYLTPVALNESSDNHTSGTIMKAFQ
jgi:hypothetical protein